MDQLDPRIGILNSGVHYAFVNGYDQPEVRGTRAEVEVALGLRSAPEPKHLPALKRYEVTLTPRIIMHGSHGASGAYTVEITARTKAKAIQAAKGAYRAEEGRFAPIVDATAVRV